MRAAEKKERAEGKNGIEGEALRLWYFLSCRRIFTTMTRP